MSGCHEPEDNIKEFCTWCRELLPCSCIVAMVRECEVNQKHQWDLMYKTTENLSKRISALEQHKNYQIDENRKISQRCDELQNYISNEEEYHHKLAERVDDLENIAIEDRLDKLEKENKMRKDTIACIDAAYDNACEEIYKRLNEIERRLDVCSTILRQTRLAPWKCPVCNGIGTRENSFLPEQIQDSNRYIDCNACNMKGVIWG